jgi:hypothetical protein
MAIDGTFLGVSGRARHMVLQAGVRSHLRQGNINEGLMMEPLKSQDGLATEITTAGDVWIHLPLHAASARLKEDGIDELMGVLEEAKRIKHG